MVSIYLDNGSSQVPFLSVPLNDLQRLSIRPLKWLRFATFAVCGARGDLSLSPGGPTVNYDATEIGESYYYTHSGETYLVCHLLGVTIYIIGQFAFVDYNALNERITSSSQTQRRSNFRRDVLERDGMFCVFTGETQDVCDAAHIIPRSKGDEVLSNGSHILLQF